MKSPAKPEPKARTLMGSDSQDSPDSQMDDTQEFQRQSAVSEIETEASATEREPSASTPPEPKKPKSGTSGVKLESAPEIVREPAPVAKPERASKKSRARSRSGIEPNNVRKLRQEAMMSKAELARRAGVSPLTIDRVEAGCPCRMDTKRKILEALGLKPSARAEVWPDIDAQS
ncbi:helix-turn-helix transcriptional regulator [Enhygromyxa salina]|uniref:Helix-turn-helix protein n=1 Tax=Enhygromyxa salina TaxID=215803 RepID=A0A2S9YIA6_9BACT|nr:helix-turn-helix transcriptional regulator [Enhygromyxa salina]PRQ04791.1 helix-turn-helix protein [Enhygromyxa salina]